MHQRKILLLENVATQAAGVREQLSQAGFQVTVSRYEADGLKRLVAWVPDLVLVSTAHPAGDFVEYCRRVRALAPAVRIIVTSSLNRDRLFEKHPGLQSIVDGVLLRPFAYEEVAAVLAPVPVASGAPAAAPGPDPGNAELRAEFQRQLDARFLEIEELKRHLEVATRRVGSAPGLEWLQSENEHLRQGVADAQQKAALALATEQLKRSEIEVKLDNLLRMKEDFEFRAQNEIEDRTQELEQTRGQLQELRERADKEAGEHKALRVELERALVEKEQIEERLHALENGAVEAAAPPADPARLAALEAELSRQRALAAEGQLAVADVAAKAAVLEESLARERAAREQQQPLLAQAGALREQVAEAQAALGAAGERRATLEKELADVQLARLGETGILSDMQKRLAAAESAAAEAQAALGAAGERRAALEKELADIQQARAAETRRAAEHRDEDAARSRELRERAESAEGRSEQLQSVCTGLEGRLSASEAARISVAAEAEALVEQRGAEIAELRARVAELDREIEPLRSFKASASEQAASGADLVGRELAESRDRARDLAAECERLSKVLAEREGVFAGEIRTWREGAAAAALAIRQLQSQAAAHAGREETERRALAERQEQAGRELEERTREIAALREELAVAGEARRREVRELEARAREAEAASREAGGRLEIAVAQLAAARTESETRQREFQLQLEAQRTAARELEDQLAARPVPENGASPLQPELHRIQELLEEVISRARTEAVTYARRDAELSARLQAALDERRLLQERFDRAGAEATERERRSSSLLQSAIDRGSSPTGERANLPAIVPLDPGPATPRRKTVLVGFAVFALTVLLALLVLRRTVPLVQREQRPVVPRPQAAGSAGAAKTPREVWDRWTRSDGAGGVLVQATLRSEQELGAEVESDNARGLSDADLRAELARRMSAFRFDTTYYVNIYLKNLAPGYPAYLDDLPGHFRLRDSSGKEVPAFLPPGHEKDRRIFSFGAGLPGDLIYEASVSLGFDRAGLSPSADYLQLIVSDVGAASRRVLTWELE